MGVAIHSTVQKCVEGFQQLYNYIIIIESHMYNNMNDFNLNSFQVLKTKNI